MKQKFKNDPQNYELMSVPHNSPDDATEALNVFYGKIEEARKECKISDILIVIKDSVKYEDGEIGQFMQHSTYGNMLNHVSMATYAYGQLQAEDRERINKLIEGKK